MPRYRLHTPLLLLLLIFCHPLSAAEDTIEVRDLWIRSAPPNVAVMAAYLRLINHGNHTVRLTGVSSRQFEKVEIHRSVIQDNMAHMEKIEPLPLAGKQEIVFEPGSFHLMLMNPHKPMLKGDQAHFVFEFDNGQQIMVPAKVRDSGPDGADAEVGEFRHQH